MRIGLVITALTVVVAGFAAVLIFGPEPHTQEDQANSGEPSEARRQNAEQGIETTHRRTGSGGVIPGRRIASPRGKWEAIVEEGTGSLRLHSIAGPRATVSASTTIPIAESGALPGLSFSPDGKTLVYPQSAYGDPDLMIVSVPPSGVPRILIDWPGPEDMPIFSADGKHLAFVSWVAGTGINSIYVIDIAVGAESAVQVTNVGVGAPLEVGKPPAGWVPPPDSMDSFRFEGDSLKWTSQGVEYTAPIPD